MMLKELTQSAFESTPVFFLPYSSIRVAYVMLVPDDAVLANITYVLAGFRRSQTQSAPSISHERNHPERAARHSGCLHRHPLDRPAEPKNNQRGSYDGHLLRRYLNCYGRMSSPS